MSKSDTFGWDLLYKVTEKQIKNTHDVLICLTHWKLIHQGFRCVGVGEDTSMPSPEEQSELLPDGWNASNKYSLRYIHNGKLYLLNAIKNDNNMIINVNRICDNNTSGTCIDTTVVKELQGSLSKLIPSYEEVIQKIAKELIDPMLKVVPSKEVQTQTPTEPREREYQVDTRRSDPFFAPERDIGRPHRPLYTDPLAVGIGRSDLDPFAAPGGGMLFDPPGKLINL